MRYVRLVRARHIFVLENLHHDAATAASDPWKVLSVFEPEPKLPDEMPTAVIHFANGRVLEPHLYTVSVIGRLPSSTTDPYLVVGGSHCTECDADNNSVYIGRPTTWPPRPDDADAKSGKGIWFSQYPHRNYNVESRTLWDWSRLFIGRCLSADRPVVISFSAERASRKQSWSRKVDWAYVEGDKLSVQTAELSTPSAPSMSAVLRAVRMKSCREIRPETFDEPF